MTTGIDQHDRGGDDHDHERNAYNGDHDWKLKENLQDVPRGGRQPTQLDHTPGFIYNLYNPLPFLVVCFIRKRLSVQIYI